MNAQDKFNERAQKHQMLGAYQIAPGEGEFKLQAYPKDIIGFLVYERNQSYGYAAWGGQGKGDALYLVAGRFEYADLRTTPDYSPSPYDLKNNPKFTLTAGAFLGDMAGLWVNGELVGTVEATESSRAYKNPYDLNVRTTKNTLFIASLTNKFNPEMLDQLTSDIDDLLLGMETTVAPPEMYINEKNDNETSVIVL